MNVQAVPIRQTQRCLLLFCTTCSWDFATGIFHLFLLPEDLPWLGDGLGWPRLCHRALARSCLLAGRDGRCPWCPAVSPTCPGSTWKKLLPSPACMGAKVVEAEGQRAKPGGCGTFLKVPALFPAEPPTFQDHPLCWLRRNQRQERASPPEWFRAIKSGTN